MLTDLQTRKLPALFAVHDANRDGSLDLADHVESARLIAEWKGHAPGSPQADDLKSAFVAFWDGLRQTADVDEDGQVGMDEWLEYWDKLLASEEMFAAVVGRISVLAVAAMDRDDDGRISRDDYRSVHHQRGADPAHPGESFERLDLDHDGYISFDEAMTLIEQFFRSDDPDAPGNSFFGPY